MSGRPAPQPRRDPARVLVVEDQALARRAVALILQLDGHHVSMAETGDEALESMDRFEPDLIVMDWLMPGLHGAELCRAIRARAPHTPIVIVSGSADAIRSGQDFAAVFGKPVDAQALRQTVAMLLATPGRSHGPARRAGVSARP
jgi:CheY-like chemotaxis protein